MPNYQRDPLEYLSRDVSDVFNKAKIAVYNDRANVKVSSGELKKRYKKVRAQQKLSEKIMGVDWESVDDHAYNI